MSSHRTSTLSVAGYPVWLLCLFVGMLALGTDEFVISGILPDVARDLGVTPGTAGLLVTGFAIAFAAGAPILAFLTDRLDKKAVLTWSLVIFAVANAAVAISDDFVLTLILRVVAGLAAAAVSPTCMVIAGMGAPEGKSGRYLAVVTAGLTVALFTGVPFGAFLGDVLSWRATFALIAAIGVLVAALSAVLAPSVPGGPVTGIAARLAPVRNPRVLGLVAAMFLSGAGGLMFYSYLGTIFTEQLGATAGDVTVALLVVGLVGVVAVFFGGALSDRLSPRPARLIVLGGHCLALGALAAYLASGAGFGLTLFLFVAVWSVFAWALSPVIQAGIMSVADDQPMLAMSLGISGLYGGSALGAALGGYLVDNYGPAAIPLVGTVWLAIGVACALVRPAPTADTAEDATEDTEAPVSTNTAS
ncbi:MFS transporter [Prauserella alba]|uniref:MFS transporter n=1 Tax=Prauserella alba TaxID=176898 RepID=A0ABN1V1T3_9PSEU|nr:MFS transporter [Prauserella alba]MCP2178817.1 putative arabinose efflux permease, MFS family [Prauserella alba]